MLIQWSNRDILMDTKLRERPAEDCTGLLECPWGNIADARNAPPVTAEQEAELDRRLNAYDVDKNRGRPVADVLADIRRRF